jgi:hypothetical protein
MVTRMPASQHSREGLTALIEGRQDMKTRGLNDPLLVTSDGAPRQAPHKAIATMDPPPPDLQVHAKRPHRRCLEHH